MHPPRRFGRSPALCPRAAPACAASPSMHPPGCSAPPLCAAPAGGEVFVAGGGNGVDWYDSVVRYDRQAGPAGGWTELAPLQVRFSSWGQGRTRECRSFRGPARWARSRQRHRPFCSADARSGGPSAPLANPRRWRAAAWRPASLAATCLCTAAASPRSSTVWWSGAWRRPCACPGALCGRHPQDVHCLYGPSCTSRQAPSTVAPPPPPLLFHNM